MNLIEYLLSIESRGIKLGLDRTTEIMKACGNPHIKLPVIQVAGTNGKGSVCAILANIFKTANYKTGLYTSPHLVRVNERIRINGISISDNEIYNFIKKYKKDIEKIGVTFFETITAIACWYFNKEKVDIAIMETGLGGRLDSVTICRPMATIITPISLDHVEILGKSLNEIAIEKSGIMKKNIPCFSSRQKTTVTKTLVNSANNIGAPLSFVNNDKKLIVYNNVLGDRQRENANLAISVIKKIDGFEINNNAIKNGLKNLTWHGRIQFLQKTPPIIFDVAHNVESIRSFVDYYSSLNILGNSTLIISIYFRKQIHNITPLLELVFHNIICTEAEIRHPMPAYKLANYFNVNHSVHIIRNPISAIKNGLDNLTCDGGLAIIGTHHFGPSIEKIFKISFDSL